MNKTNISISYPENRDVNQEEIFDDIQEYISTKYGDEIKISETSIEETYPLEENPLISKMQKDINLLKGEACSARLKINRINNFLDKSFKILKKANEALSK